MGTEQQAINTQAASLASSEYLIIAGTTKAATTSLFIYLSEHPEVCASSLKETHFFLAPDYPAPPSETTYLDGVEQYDAYFSRQQPGEHLRVEATADYLASDGTAALLNNSLPGVKVVITLREPVSRLKSWYKFALQESYLPKDMSFEEYVRIQLDGEEAIARAEQTATDRDNRLPLRYYLSALEQGRYADYIEEYVKHVTPERLLLLYYEDIQKDAVACMKTICRFANIDPEFYTDFTPKRHNQSVAVKSDAAHKFYRRWRIRIRQRTHKLRIHNLLRWIKRRVDTVYNRLNTEVAVADELPEDLRTRLEAYYREDRKRVEALVGRPAPW